MAKTMSVMIVLALFHHGALKNIGIPIKHGFFQQRKSTGQLKPILVSPQKDISVDKLYVNHFGK